MPRRPWLSQASRRAPVVKEVSGPEAPSNPVVSVLMLTYNHQRFVAQAIESVLAQEAPFPYELVIGDDCSTDATRDILLGYQDRYRDRIRVLLQSENSGGGRNAADCHAACRGKYVATLEGDDFWTDPLKLQLQVDLLESNPGAIVCGARAWLWKEGDAGPHDLMPGEDGDLLASYGARELFEGKWWFRTCTKMFPRHLIQQVPLRYRRDWAELMWLIARTGFGQVCFLDRVVGVYREHDRGSWSSLSRSARLASDVGTLDRLIPVFAGSDRVALKELMTTSVAEILRSDGTTTRTAVRCAALALRHSPGDPRTWRHLASGLGRWLVHPY